MALTVWGLIICESLNLPRRSIIQIIGAQPNEKAADCRSTLFGQLLPKIPHFPYVPPTRFVPDVKVRMINSNKGD